MKKILFILLFPLFAYGQTQVNTNQIRDQAVTLPKMGTTGSTEGQSITSAGSGITPVWGGPYALRYMNTIVYTTNHTLTLNDGETGKVHMRSVSGLTLEVPLEATEALPDGFMVMVIADSAAVTVDPEAGVQIEPATADLVLDEDQYAVLIKRNSDTWDYFGPVSSGSAHVIEDEGTPVTQRANMNFTGAGVSVADAGGKTVVTISSGGITNSAGNNVIPKSDGTDLIASSMTQASTGAITTTIDDASTNTILYNDFVRTSSGTPAAGIGTGLRATVETTAANNEVIGMVEFVPTDLTGASEDADIVFKTMTAGAAATEKFRILSTGGISAGSTTQSPFMTWTYPLTGGFTSWRAVSSATNLMEIGFESNGQFGGSANNVNGTQFFLYDLQASAYRMGVNVSGDLILGASSTNYGFTATQAGVLTLGRKTTGPGEFRIGEDADNGSNYAGFTVGSSLAGNTVYTLPTAFPSVNNSTLLSSTAGAMSWVATTLDVDASNVGNVTTGEDQLYSYTLDAGRLATDEQAIIIRAGGTLAGNGNTKTIKVKFGATEIVNFSGTFTSSWGINCELVRTGAATQDCTCMIVGASSGITHANITNPGETLSGTVAIVITGEGTATNDIVKTTASVRFEP